MAEPSYEELKARVTKLEKQTGGRRSGELEFKVGGEGRGERIRTWSGANGCIVSTVGRPKS
jgi:hypothetical protein